MGNVFINSIVAGRRAGKSCMLMLLEADRRYTDQCTPQKLADWASDWCRYSIMQQHCTDPELYLDEGI